MSTADQTVDLDATVEQLMKFTPEQRVEIGERLLASVPMFPDKETEEKLAKTVERRIRELEDGTVQAIPFEEAVRIVEDDLKEMQQAREDR